MADEFRGLAITTGTVVGNTGTDIFNVQMPADIIAGDYLFIMFGGSFDLRTIDHENPNGTWTNIGTGADHARIADGSEAGASIPFVSWNGGFTGSRPVTAVALCYRFPYTPTPGGIYGALALQELGARHYSNTLPADSSTVNLPFSVGGQFGANVGAARMEFRIYHTQGQTVNSDATEFYDPSSMVWSGDLLTDRTGLLPSIGGTFPDGIDSGADTVADAFYLSIPETGTAHDTKIVINGPGTGGSGFMQGWALFFPLVIVSDYWGILNP